MRRWRLSSFLLSDTYRRNWRKLFRRPGLGHRELRRSLVKSSCVFADDDCGRGWMCGGTEHRRKCTQEACSNARQASAYHCSGGFESCPEGDWNIIPCWVSSEAEMFEGVKSDHGGYANAVMGRISRKFWYDTVNLAGRYVLTILQVQTLCKGLFSSSSLAVASWPPV